MEDEFSAIYCVNDWGSDAYFIGDNYQKDPNSGTHSHLMQTDPRIIDGMVIDLMWPDGTVSRSVKVYVGKIPYKVGDMGRCYYGSSDSPFFNWKGARIQLSTDMKAKIVSVPEV